MLFLYRPASIICNLGLAAGPHPAEPGRRRGTRLCGCPLLTVLLLYAGICRILGAFVQTREDRIGDRLAFDQVDHDRRRLVAHLEGTLADERGHEAFLGDRDFIADGIGGADHMP